MLFRSLNQSRRVAVPNAQDRIRKKCGRRLSSRCKSVAFRSFECTSKQAHGFVLSFPLFRPQGLNTSRGDVWAPRAEGGASRAAIYVAFVPCPRGCSSAGRAPALQAGGQRFESAHLHQHIDNRIGLSRSPECRKAKLDPLSNF